MTNEHVSTWTASIYTVHLTILPCGSACVYIYTKKSIGDSAFSTAASRLWNELSVNIHASGTVSIFRKRLKTYVLLDISINSFFLNDRHCVIISV